MYFALTTIDWLVQTSWGLIAVLLDERSPEAIADDKAISIVFAASRIRLVRTHEKPIDAIRFLFPKGCPPFLQQVVRAAGAKVVESTEQAGAQDDDSPAQDDARVDAIVHEALMQLGQKILNDANLAPNEAALVRMQQTIRNKLVGENCEPQPDEENYHRSMIELGAVVGVVMNAERAGHFAHFDEFGPVPFSFDIDGNYTNVFGRISRYFEQGESQAPAMLLAMVRDQSSADAPLTLTLRDPAFVAEAAASSVRQKPLFEGGPIICFGLDSPSSFGFLRETDPRSLEELVEESLRNVGKIAVRVAARKESFGVVVGAFDSFYAAEKILDIQFLVHVRETLGASNSLWAGVPTRGLALVMPAGSSAQLHAFSKHLAMIYDSEPGNRRIFRKPLLIAGNRIVGLATSGTWRGWLLEWIG